ncbi:MAG: class I SAM-dependent methyltransferase [Fibrobacteres bacterium]|nr:class I SAM-dependent methyltransferase [Fibrobacterota bacterium]
MKARDSGMPAAQWWNTFFDAQGVLDALVPEGGACRVVEFGSGYGTFTFPLAKRTGTVVVALDIEPDLVQALGEHPGVEARLRDFVADGTGEADASADHALLYNILHIEDPVALLAESWRILRPGATVSVIHWRRDIETPRGPSLDIRPSPDQCSRWMIEAGFTEVHPVDLSPWAPWHYGLVGHRPQSANLAEGA